VRTHYHAETNRWWLYGKNHRTKLSLEWQWLRRARFCGFEISFSRTWKLRQIFIGLPWVFSWWITFGDPDDDTQYELGLKIHSSSVWLMLFSNPDEWNRSDPWYRKQHSLNLTDLILGRQQCRLEKLEEQPVQIPMPEGVYSGVAVHERRTWRRPRWFQEVRDSIWITVEKGVPFPGKGENSWDCGMDGLVSAGIDGVNVEKAIGHFVGSVLESRRKYGGKNWKLENKSE
jgi:hypothetical protein